MADRLARRRRLVLDELAAGPAGTADLARRVGGDFYEVFGVLDELRLSGAVDRVGCLWRIVEHDGDELGGARVNPRSRVHRSAIDTPSPATNRPCAQPGHMFEPEPAGARVNSVVHTLRTGLPTGAFRSAAGFANDVHTQPHHPTATTSTRRELQ